MICLGHQNLLRFAIVILFGFFALASRNAWADTNLLSTTTWVVDGTDDTGASPTNITLSVDGLPVSSFSELVVSYNDGGSGIVSVATINGSGGIRLSLPPPGVFGGTFFTAGYWDCDVGLVPTMAVTELDIRLRRGRIGFLQLKGKLSNLTSMEAKDFTMLLYPPQSTVMRADVSYSLRATRDICVSQTNSVESDVFRAATMAANYLSTNVQENDEARYVRITEKICFGFGCVIKKKSFCQSLVNTNGFLIDTPRRLGNTTLLLVHTQPLPNNTPTLSVRLLAPSHAQIRPQGFTNMSSDPTDQNVSFWGNWIGARKRYRARQRIGRFRYTLQAVPAQVYTCDDSR